jgi:hypothetical protein
MALLDHPTRRQRGAGIAAAFAIVAPVAAYLIGQAWVASATETDPVPQGTMVSAYLLFAPVVFLSAPVFFFSLVVIVAEEMGKRKRR